MTWKQSVSSAVQAFAVFLFLGAAVALFMLPYTPEARIILSDLILHREDLLQEAGVGLFVVGLFFLFAFYGLGRGYYLVLKMGKNTLAVDEKILWQTVEPELKKHFLGALSLEKIEIGRGKRLFFGLEMNVPTEEEGEKILHSAEKHLELLLRERFGYKRAFTVQVFPRANAGAPRGLSS